MSLKQIAEIVGVSPSTVSRVLNHKDANCASKEIQARIFETAHALGYVPNDYARQLQNKSRPSPQTNQKRIYIIMTRNIELERDPFFREISHIISQELFQYGCNLEQTMFPEEFLARKPSCDGLILLGRCSEKQLRQLKRITPNIIGIWRNSMNFEVDEVICDGKKAAELAVSHLLSLGHQKIAYIGDCSYETRYVGYCEMLIRNQLPINYDLIVPADHTMESGYEAMKQLIPRMDSFTALFCASDVIALGAMNALTDNGKKATDISIISIDNIEELQKYSPLLTTVDIPRSAMAHMAVLLLTDRIAHSHTEYMRLELPCRIVQRESTFAYK